MHELVQDYYDRSLKSSTGFEASAFCDASAAPAATNIERSGCC